jgi:hypothetical protein
MGKVQGRHGKIVLGSSKIKGMGNWAFDGIQTDQLDTTEFGDDWKMKDFGIKDGGGMNFGGFFEPDDQTGIQKILEANLYNSDLTDLKFHLDSTRWYEPCQTTGYFSPYLTTGAPTQKSYINVTGYNVQNDKSGMLSVTCQGQISGCMVLVQS